MRAAAGGRSSFWSRNWKVIVNAITVALLVVFIVLIRGQIASTFTNLGRVHWQVLLLMLPLVLLSYHAQTKLYVRLFGLIGHRLSYGFMFRAALELNFVNQVLPSGGVSGISYFGVRMRGAGATGAQASLVQVIKLLLLFISFEVLLVAGLLALAIAGRANDFMLLVGGSITTLLLAGTATFMLVIGSERRIQTLFEGVTRLINRLVGVFWRRGREQAITASRARRVVNDLHNSYKTIEAQYRQLLVPLLWAVVTNGAAILMIYIVYVAFGQWVNIGAVILAYAVANFAGLVSILPGGAGIYEALMTGVLVAGGIPAALSLPATVMFRVLSSALQLPPGYVLYRQALRRGGTQLPLDRQA